YGNELTGLCRPEELFRLTDCARRVAKRYNLTIDSAMITDVPGYTWGIVPALAHSGVKYLSAGPNHIHRICYTLAEWGDKPFWWVSPSGEKRILCWVAGRSYSWFHRGRLGPVKGVKPDTFFEYLEELQASGYVYDMVQLRYSIQGDNGPPDPELPEFVRRWNGRYVWPKLRIATTRELMTAFERRYGDRLPERRGDFTPYWEDGAASSARETALARNASERLVQAETLWALLNPTRFPDAHFATAWRDVILYNEHTWGAYCSISKPDSQLTRDQWRIKQAFARDADRQSRSLLHRAAAKRRSGKTPVAAVDVYNTCSWPRDDLVILPRNLAVAGDVVQTADGQSVPSQRLTNGRLAFLARGVPPLGAKRFVFKPGETRPAGRANAGGRRLTTPALEIEVDAETGAIERLVWKPAGDDFAGGTQRRRLNTYHYVPSRDPQTAQELAAGVTVRVEDAGPLVASLVVESPAPGCRKLTRRLRVVDGLPFVSLCNVVDKEPIRTPESVHFGFDVNVPGGIMRLDIPWAIIRPETDQLPGA
ncbi:MAG TPA: glycoside hydrolase, partial [Planctomycetaceae bacterium]|nr:glycoside hydrolase [Planctomycetaceae bacterium]